MSKELVEEIMQLETEAEQELLHADEQVQSILKRAHEQAHLKVQEAERTLDTAREKAIREHDSTVHSRKETVVSGARAEAQTLAAHVKPKTDKAAAAMLERFVEYTRDGLS